MCCRSTSKRLARYWYNGEPFDPGELVLNFLTKISHKSTCAMVKFEMLLLGSCICASTFSALSEDDMLLSEQHCHAIIPSPLPRTVPYFQ